MAVTLTNKVGGCIFGGKFVIIDSYSTNNGNIYTLEIEQDFAPSKFWKFDDTNGNDIRLLITYLVKNNSGVVYNNNEYILMGPKLKDLKGEHRILEIFDTDPFIQNVLIENWLDTLDITTETLYNILDKNIGFYPEIYKVRGA